MTDCANGEIRDLLPELLHDRLTPAEQRRVQMHVDGCGECRAELALLRVLRASMHHVPAIDAARVSAAIPAYRAPVRRTWATWRVAAAVVLIAAGGTSVALVQRGAGTHSTASAVAPTAVAVTGTPTTAGASTSPDSDATVAAAPARRELALASASIGELDDRELSALVKDIERFDAVPSAEVENGTAATPLSPRGDE